MYLPIKEHLRSILIDRIKGGVVTSFSKKILNELNKLYNEIDDDIDHVDH